MRSALLRRTLPLTAVALMAGLGLPSAQAGVAGPGGGHPLRARITGAPIPGTSAAAAPARPGTKADALASPSGPPNERTAACRLAVEDR